MDAWVDKVDRDEAKVTLANGTVITADLLIGADGIRSQVRKFAVMPNEIVEPHTTTNCAYRAIVPGHIMRADPKVAHLMDEPYSNCWIGYRRHIMAYPIRNGTLYNMVMSHPGQATVGLWNEPGNLEEMKAHYAGWDPIIDSILPKIEGCLKWKLADLPALSTWVSDTGKAVLIGDAAHAMVPYLAQGAAQAIEDAATIAECIDRARSTEDFSKVLAIYQSIRKPRCEKIQKGSMDSGDIWHIPDGPEQVARDADMKIVMDIFAAGETVAITKKSGKPNPNRWSDEEFQSWLFGHDAVTHVSFSLPPITLP